MIEIDGSLGEGGGQILRTSLALSAITGKSFSISNIRKGRCKGGLAPQHLKTVEAITRLTDATVEGAEEGSCSLKFEPKALKGRTIAIDIGTAGSITLLLQSAILASMFVETKVRWKMTGGTDVNWSMPFDYMRYVFMPQLSAYAKINLSLSKRGYYPIGGGQVDIVIKPHWRDIQEIGAVKPLEKLDTGKLIQIRGISHAAQGLMKDHVAERQAKAAKVVLSKKDVQVKIDSEYTESECLGSGITVWAVFSPDTGHSDFEEAEQFSPVVLGGDSLGEKKKRAEVVGQEAGENLLKQLEGGKPVDEYLADNLVPYMALFGGKLKANKLTAHTMTNIMICEKFLGVKFDIDEIDGILAVKKPYIEMIKKEN